MKLYHYMDAAAYGALLADGRITGSKVHSTFPEFEQPYAWLAEVMRKRIGDAPSHADPDWPVFAWHSHDGLDPVAYDRRSEDESELLVGFDVPEGRYLLSDFVDWHFVLNGWYMPSCGADDDAGSTESDAFDEMCKAAGYDIWTAGPDGPAPEVEAARRRQWERVVDHPHATDPAQATLWELRLEWVFFVKVRRRGGLEVRRQGKVPSIASLSRD